MDVLNAISKVRFNSARPQRVQLSRCDDYLCELICLEPGQELTASGRCEYYVIAGSGEIRAGGQIHETNLGHFINCEESEPHTIVNSSEQRLIFLAVS